MFVIQDDVKRKCNQKLVSCMHDYTMIIVLFQLVNFPKHLATNEIKGIYTVIVTITMTRLVGIMLWGISIEEYGILVVFENNGNN